jgi:hypothetical protein
MDVWDILRACLCGHLRKTLPKIPEYPLWFVKAFAQVTEQ